MLDIKDREYFDEVKEFARKTGQVNNLAKNLNWLRTYSCFEGKVTRCEVYSDFVTFSFQFIMFLKRPEDKEFQRWFIGKLVYHGPSNGDGDSQGWSIHIYSGRNELNMSLSSNLPECLTIDNIVDAVEEDDYIGLCTNCGAENYNVEPDARNYKCEDCGSYSVYGAEELLMTYG